MIALLDASPNANTGTDRAIIEVIVVLLNVSVLIWPLLRKFLSGTFHGYYEQLVGVQCVTQCNWRGNPGSAAAVGRGGGVGAP